MLKVLLRIFPLIAILSLACPQRNWEIISGEAKMIDDVIALNNALILWREGAPPDFVLRVKMNIQEKRENAEGCVLIGAPADASQFLQIFLDQPSNSLRVAILRRGSPTTLLATIGLPFKVKMQEWHEMTVVVKGQEVFAYLDGNQYLHLKGIRLWGKRVGLRVGDGRTSYKDFALQKLKDLSLATCKLGIKCPSRCYLSPRYQGKSLKIEGETIKLKIPTFALPLQMVTIGIDYQGRVPLLLTVYDGKGSPYYSQRIQKPTQVSFRAVGSLGKHRLEIKKGKEAKSVFFDVDAETEIKGTDPLWERLFATLRETVKRDRFVFSIDGKPVAMNPTWLRDHIHEMKGYKWWEEDIRSAIDHFLKIQHPEGFFYEMIIPPSDPHTTFVKDKHRLIDERNNLAYVRLELEADIEYLMVEGAFQIWQATGDDEWLKWAIPRLIKGMEHCMTDPTRWDPQHQLVKRPFTIDTWDFTYGIPGNDRRITEDTPMSIMHGDNSGMFHASLLLSRMLSALRREGEAEHWRKIAEGFKERTNKLCWNGKFYTHQIHLNHPGAPGVDEREILSLSNTYDINRGLPDHEQAVSIISEYKRRKELTKGEYFAEWFSIHPPYPDFKGHNMPPGTYINGGVAGFVAGELAKACFWHGEEAYGVDILRRLGEKIEKDGDIFFLYTPDGRDQGGGPRGWSASAVISALIEGLAGIRDDEKLFHRATLAPRWISAGEKEVKVIARYGASKVYLGYLFRHNEKDKKIEMEISGSGTLPTFHILLPPHSIPKKVLFNGEAIPFYTERIEESIYCNFGLKQRISRGEVTVYYE